MNNDRLNIIARYNEDISWVKNLSGKSVIYNKGALDFDNSFISKNVENIGRETETYIRSIIDFYEQLPNFKHVLFLQGNPFEHCKILYDLIDKEFDQDFVLIGDYGAMHPFPKDNYINGIHKHVIDILLTNKRNIKIKNDYIDKGALVDKSSEVEEMIYLCQLLKIPYENLNQVVWCCGAQYLVKTNKLLDKNIDWWNNALELVIYAYKELKYDTLGYAMERIWPLIWNHKT